MNMRDSVADIYKVLTHDEDLLRLLYYKPTNPSDSPLKHEKPNILSMDEKSRWKIIRDVIKPSTKSDDLVKESKCRLYVYSAERQSGKLNYLYSDQHIIFDVLVHCDIQDMDLRLEWICDRVNELVYNKRITGFGKIQFVKGGIIPSPEGYVGYRLIYKFTSENE